MTHRKLPLLFPEGAEGVVVGTAGVELVSQDPLLWFAGAGGGGHASHVCSRKIEGHVLGDKWVNQ